MLVQLTIEGNCLKEEHESHEEGEPVSPFPIESELEIVLCKIDVCKAVQNFTPWTGRGDDFGRV